MLLDALERNPAPGGRRKRSVGGWWSADGPHLLIRHVGQCRPVRVAEEMQEAEDEVALGGGVGDDDVGTLPAVLVVDDIDHVE